MSTLVRIPLSGSTNGKPFIVAGISTGNTPVHTAHSSANDYVTLYAANNDTTDRLLTVEVGGTGNGEAMKQTVYAQVGRQTVLDRHLIQSALAITAFAAASSVVVLSGWVDRETA